MQTDFFALYEALASSVTSAAPVETLSGGARWAAVQAAGSLGLAMMTPGDSVAPLYPGGLAGLELKDAARAAMSWNLTEASYGLAAANAFLNTPRRLEELGCAVPFERWYTDGVELRGKTVALIGHMGGPPGLRESARAVYVLERAPKPGDYPDAACDWLLPRCDVVIITGSSLVNKTLPHLLSLCKNAYTILTGPSVPLCPALLDFGIDRLAGLSVTDCVGADAHVRASLPGNPYRFGQSFLLEK